MPFVFIKKNRYILYLFLKVTIEALVDLLISVHIQLLCTSVSTLFAQTQKITFVIGYVMKLSHILSLLEDSYYQNIIEKSVLIIPLMDFNFSSTFYHHLPIQFILV